MKPAKGRSSAYTSLPAALCIFRTPLDQERPERFVFISIHSKWRNEKPVNVYRANYFLRHADLAFQLPVLGQLS